MTDRLPRAAPEPAPATEQSSMLPRCSTTSANLDEPVLGTASVVRTWLLLEHPGAWSRAALRSRGFRTDLGAELARRANRHHVRIVLIRRPGRTAPDLPLACFAASTGPVGSWLGHLTLARAEEVLDLDLAELGPGSRTPFVPVELPLLCVCTHGSHDPCCAERGRPVAAALAGRFPAQTWEVSHIGGDRFAGNLVCFPDGDYLGRLDATTAVPVVEAYLGGHYVLPHLRGRAGFAPVVQAAEILVRGHLGITARPAVRVLDARQDGGEAVIRLLVEGHGELAASVRVISAEPERALTCHGVGATAPPAYRLLDLVRVPEVAGSP